jgi:hypothetical protein
MPARAIAIEGRAARWKTAGIIRRPTAFVQIGPPTVVRHRRVYAGAEAPSIGSEMRKTDPGRTSGSAHSRP